MLSDLKKRVNCSNWTTPQSVPSEALKQSIKFVFKTIISLKIQYSGFNLKPQTVKLLLE